MRILLIDDDKDDQALFCEAVARIEPKLQIEVAENGEQGIVNLASKVDLPVLVFLDINMPVLNGWDTLDLIRSNPGMSGSRVVIYSTSSQQADKARAERFGASFISKSTASRTWFKAYPR